MENRTICLESTAGIRLNTLGDENFVMAIEGQNFVFSFDAMYDLAIRMTMMIQNAEAALDAADAAESAEAGDVYDCGHAVAERVLHS